MINPSVAEDNDNAERLAPFNTLQTMIIASKIADPSTNNSLPRNLMNLVGVHWLNLVHHEENVACLSALVDFMIKQGRPFNTDEVEGIATAVKGAGFTQGSYVATFARVIELLGNQKEALLIKAAAAGNTLAVVQLLKIQGININAKDPESRTALMWAAIKGHTTVVITLLKVDGILVNDINVYGTTALMQAAANGHPFVVAALLQKNDIDVDAVNIYGWTALTGAAQQNHRSIVYQLCLKQLFDAPHDQGHTLFRALSTQGSIDDSKMILTPLALGHFLLNNVAALHTTAEKIALLEQALSRTHAFSAVMTERCLSRIQEVYDVLKTQRTPVVVFSRPAADMSSLIPAKKPSC